MLFNSFIFIFAFLPVVFTSYFVIARFSHSYAATWLALASVFFYGYWNSSVLPLLLGSICGNYCLGIVLCPPEIDTEWKKRRLLFWLSITLNLGVLAYFKYINFFIYNFNELLELADMNPIISLRVIFPLGISFFTFTQIAFLVDSYHGKVNERRFTHYLLFVTFFPHLIAGPIIHHKQMMPQFADPDIYRLNTDKIAAGLAIFIIGLSKKLLLADPLGTYASLFYDGLGSGLTPPFLLSWLGSLSYTFQVYFDFSGYSDMAVGLALLFGILLPFNFKSPYKATSVIDFWQRWHITLTTYVWEYVYTPLTMKCVRLSRGKSQSIEFLLTFILPTFIAFLLIGFWHGASWTYIWFGAIQAALVLINRLWRKWAKRCSSAFYVKVISGRYIGWLLTFVSINFSIVMFRADNVAAAIRVFCGMLGINDAASSGTSGDGAVWQGLTFNNGHFGPWFSTLLALSSFITFAFPNTSQLTPEFTKTGTTNTALINSRWVAIGLSILLVLSILNFNKTSPFLYFQF